MIHPLSASAVERRDSWSDRGVAASLILATFMLHIFPLMDTDFWWHLKTGQLIWERGTVPRTDWYLFTDANRPWIDLHWGFQLIVAGLFALGGVNLVILFKAVIFTAAVFLAWSAAGREAPAWLRSLLWIPAIICISGRGYERPEMFSMLFLAVWLWIAFRAETRPRWMWWLPVVQIAWINCHALFILGLVVGACFAVDHVIRKIAAGRWGLAPVAPTSSTLQIFGAGGLCALAALANPYFLDGALFPLVLYRKFNVERDFYANIGEFQRPFDFFAVHGLSNIYLLSQAILAGLTIASFIILLAKYGRWSPFRVLLFALFLNLAWQATRNTNVFSLVAATMLVANATEIWKCWLSERERAGDEQHLPRGNPGPAETLSRPSPSNQSPRMANLSVMALLLGWLCLTIAGVWGRFTNEGKTCALGMRPWWFAHEAMTFAGQPGFPTRAIVAHIGLAGTYEYLNSPSHKVFLDARLEVSTPQTYQAQGLMLDKMRQGDRSWERLVKDADGNLPVVILDSRNSRLAIEGLLHSPGWRLVYADPAAGVFLTSHQADALDLPPADIQPLMYPPSR